MRGAKQPAPSGQEGQTRSNAGSERRVSQRCRSTPEEPQKVEHNPQKHKTPLVTGHPMPLNSLHASIHKMYDPPQQYLPITGGQYLPVNGCLPGAPYTAVGLPAPTLPVSYAYQLGVQPPGVPISMLSVWLNGYVGPHNVSPLGGVDQTRSNVWVASAQTVEPAKVEHRVARRDKRYFFATDKTSYYMTPGELQHITAQGRMSYRVVCRDVFYCGRAQACMTSCVQAIPTLCSFRGLLAHSTSVTATKVLRCSEMVLG